MTAKQFGMEINVDRDVISQEFPTQRVLEIAIQAPEAAAVSSRPRLNLAIVLDRSGSMGGEKLVYARLAALHVLDMLQDQDQVAVVAYDDAISLIAPSLPVTATNRESLKRAILAIEPGGSTNLSGGWLAGCQEVAAAAQKDTLNRALLLTDGEANAGITDLEELARHAKELAARGITTSTFGVGHHFNEHLLEAMASQGSGSFYYISTPAEIAPIFEREFKELAAVTIRDVEVTLEYPARVNPQLLGGWNTSGTSGLMHIAIGVLYSGRREEIYVKLLIPPMSKEPQLTFRVKAFGKGESGGLIEAQSEVTLIYAPHSQAEAAPLHKDLLERYAPVDLAEAANEALKLERTGDHRKASSTLKQSLEENRPYLDPARSNQYEQMSERMKRGMDELDQKSSHYNSYNDRRKKQS